MASFLETTRIRGLNGQEDKVSLTFFSFPDFEDYFEWKNKVFCLFFYFFENVTFFRFLPTVDYSLLCTLAPISKVKS